MDMLPTSAIVVNLASRKDRWNYMQKVGQRLGLRLQRLDAVNGHAVSLNDVSLSPLVRSTLLTNRKFSIVHIESRGALGCYLSHKLAWEQATRVATPTIVLEDDAEPMEDGRKWMQRAWSEVQFGKWDLVVMGRHDNVSTTSIQLFPTWMETGIVKTGSWAYIVSPQAAQRLLDASKVLEYQVDIFLHTIGLKVGYISAFAQATFFRTPDIRHFPIEQLPKAKLVAVGAIAACAVHLVVGLVVYYMWKKR